MKTKISLLLLLLCLLPMGMKAENTDLFWTDNDVLNDVSVGRISNTPTDVLVNEDNKIYTVYTAKGLAWIAKVTNGGLTNISTTESNYYPLDEGFENCTIKLDGEDKTIDLSEHFWMPIGDYKRFQGTFDGNGNRVTGLKMKDIGKDVTNLYLGLFGRIYKSKVYNLGVEIGQNELNVNILGFPIALYYGGIIGYMQNSEILNCYIYSSNRDGVNIISDNIRDNCIGGLVGSNYNSKIMNCYSMININADISNGKLSIGGIIGDLYSSNLFYSYSTSTINAINSPIIIAIGGIAGNLSNSKISNNIALNTEVSVEGTPSNAYGGKIGYNEGDNSFANNYVSPKFKDIEGLTSNYGSFDGDELTPNQSIQEILSPDENTDSPWEFPTDGGLPYLKTFERKEQGAGKVEGRDYLDFSLKLKDNLADGDRIYINYNQDDKWFVTDQKVTCQNRFNGEINASTINKGLSIFNNDILDYPQTLRIIGDLKINTTDVPALEIHKNVNIDIDKNKTINITSSKEYAIDNYGTLNISNSEVVINANDDKGINNQKQINIKGNCVLKVITPSNINPIKNTSSSAKFIIEPGSTLLTWKKGENGPTPSTIQSIDAGSGSLAVTDQNNIPLAEGVKIGEGAELRVTPSGYSQEVEAIIFTDASGNEYEVSDKLGNDYYSYPMPAGNVSISVKLKERKPDPIPDPEPTITYIVSVPEVEGVDTDPDPGEYEVDAWDSFIMELKLDSAYNQSLPVVTTSRGETITPRQSDGLYVIKYIRTDVDIYIDGIFKNPDPVGTEALIADAIRITGSAEGVLIYTPQPSPCTIYNIAGQMLHASTLPAGDSRIRLAPGLYIVRVGEISVKVKI